MKKLREIDPYIADAGITIPEEDEKYNRFHSPTTGEFASGGGSAAGGMDSKVAKQVNDWKTEQKWTQEGMTRANERVNQAQQTHGFFSFQAKQAKKDASAIEQKDLKLRQKIGDWEGLAVHPDTASGTLKKAGNLPSKGRASSMVSGYSTYSNGFEVTPSKGRLIVSYRHGSVASQETIKMATEGALGKYATALTGAGFSATREGDNLVVSK